MVSEARRAREGPMNYLAHSLPFVFRDDELAAWQVVGTALPDWLRAVDRGARLRPDVLDRAIVADSRHHALREGARRHHDDDVWFHAHDDFETLTALVAADARRSFPHLRTSALAHITVELLLDAALMERHPTLLDRFYAAIDVVDEGIVAHFARATTARPVPHAEIFVDRFRRARFLALYSTDDGLLSCLRGVWLRAGIGGIDDGFIDVVAAARPRVYDVAGRFFSTALPGSFAEP
jgi:hypothetical protein